VNRLMASLTVPSLPGSTAVAPHLSRLIFMCKEETSIDFAAYLQVVKSRPELRPQGCRAAYTIGPWAGCRDSLWFAYT
jgi:hypothetical protein